MLHAIGHRFHNLRHTFGTAMAGAGMPMRTPQEWMGHRELQTTLIYADYVPNAGEVEMVDRAFATSVVVSGACVSFPRQAGPRRAPLRSK